MPDDTGFTLHPARARLLIRGHDLPQTAHDVLALLARAGGYFERGGPVRLVTDPQTNSMVVRRLTKEAVIIAVHQTAQPYTIRNGKHGAEEVEATLPDRVAGLALEMATEGRLPPLHGIAYAPILLNDGTIRAHDGYDPHTGLWCARVPDLAGQVPDAPTRQEAEAALMTLRQIFATFPFADAPRRLIDSVQRVDLTKPPGMDESSFLAGLLTALVRPSLGLSPALMLRAPNINGSGTGKGLLARAICAIAYGLQPQAFTVPTDRSEMEKRLSATLMEAGPALFMDNVNNTDLQSDLLASVLTENPAAVRVLGRSEMLRINSSSVIIVTGNGLGLSEDLVRRFITVELDAHSEDPENRSFPGDLLADVTARRASLLAAALTIWKWGRQNEAALRTGATLGSYPRWAQWVRDPLLTLGVADPVARIAETKAADPKRLETVELFQTWQERHGAKPVKLNDLHEDVRAIINPQGRSRQFLASTLSRLVGTRIANLTLTLSKGGKWSAATYAVLPALPFD